MFASTGEELLEICKTENILIYEYAIKAEQENGYSRENIISRMRENLKVMQESASYGLYNETKSVSGMIGGEALKLNRYIETGSSIVGSTLLIAMARALSCSEVNASMGKIVAAPTAGSCGIIPAAIITTAEKFHKTEEDMINSLFTASALGAIIAQNATLAGAEGGCQAECGSAAAMAAGAVVEMMGGTPEQSLSAAAIALQNIMGLICDPIAGLVECPCANRNASGVVNALSSAEMVLSGIHSLVPFDETVSAMYKVGRAMPETLRETGLGGIAATSTGIKLKKSIFKVDSSK
ncbi:L-serine ammonia-lyase, iron-sulfur-dependent, subunit alpha [Clostridium sp. 19966]|uniref:L-serine ammonia-lyase, iron-sulfur-dependent, subunit alpha n=1 Tax=Clostridium sp. 19966 TaxID=2768166 RepID=UPI0028E06A49|nr:L-serine ammonia-lyase, iron-sulfur-dependent, subunit alpha [Clostridium sp. 19966]MDT8718523.1 L-serine ammonia-lyase, iron-sulfur-dependent, subunit alpha [Clostridium sp. 19966]